MPARESNWQQILAELQFGEACGRWASSNGGDNVVPRRIYALATTALGVLALLVAPGVAHAQANEPTGGLDSVPINQAAPRDTTPITADQLALLGGAETTLDLASSQAVTDILAGDDARAINTVTWDSTRDVLHFYVYQPNTDLTTLIDAALPAGRAWDVIPSQRSVTELEQLIMNISSDRSALPQGVTFTSGKAAPDGSSITIGVDRSASPLLRTAPLPTSIATVPVTYVEEQPAVPARSRDIAPVISGAYMEGPTSRGQEACSTGFPVFRNQDSQYNMITSDHCTDLQGVTWTYGQGSHSVGTSTFQAAGDTDLELYIQPASLSTWVFVGSYTDASSVLPIRGYTAPVGGTNVCYSGSRSGLVCNSVLESSDTWSCVAFLQCYWTRWSTQSSGIAAAGNGDSGGPVIALVQRTSDSTIGAYGVGAISMLNLNNTTTCTGEPGSSAPDGRKCSANMGFAPLSRWASSQSTHSLVYTTQ